MTKRAEKPMLTMSELAARLGVSISVASRRIERRGIKPDARRGAAKLYAPETVLALAPLPIGRPRSTTDS